MRDATRMLAVELYNKGHDFLNSDRAYGFVAPDRQKALRIAQEKVEDAQKTLDEICDGIGLRIAVDTLLPGWVDIDASDHLPREKWHVFLASTKEEWVTWLVENGVGNVIAQELVEDQWPDETDTI